MNRDERRREPTAIDDVRVARASVSLGGFAQLRDRLQQMREELRSRQGPFADLPAQQPDDVREMIDAVAVNEPLIAEIRAVRHDVAARGTGTKG